MVFRYEQLLVGVALASLIASAAWFTRLPARIREPLESAPSVRPAYPSIHYVEHLRAPSSWEPPSGQRTSQEWIYEVFTPPTIFYDAGTNAFTVQPPSTTMLQHEKPEEPAVRDELSSIQLIAVGHPLFRIQLIGFCKTEQDSLGLFENTETSETFVGRSGEHFDSLHLVIEALRIDPQPVRLEESMTTLQLRATACIRDERTGATVELTTQGRCHAGKIRAIVALMGPEENRHEIGEGDLLDVAGSSYEVREIRLTPPSVELRRRPSEHAPAGPAMVSLSLSKSTSLDVPST